MGFAGAKIELQRTNPKTSFRSARDDRMLFL
jgi:hypothetical protein